jgi:hypothetical protein
MPNIMTPSNGLIHKVSIAIKGAGIITDSKAISKTSAPIQRAIKLQISFIITFLLFWLQSYNFFCIFAT